jgi:hypothetical protein
MFLSPKCHFTERTVKNFSSNDHNISRMVVSEKKKLHKECDIFYVWQWEPAPAGNYHYSCNGTYEM